MADKRMFTRKVTDSDDFISLSSSAQAMYLHLCQSADDDGFNNQVNMAMYKAHASVDDLKVLLAKRFILQFDNGVIVIKHWRMANALRKDRYNPTNYQEELKMLSIKEDGSYTDGCQMVAKWLPNGCRSIGKVSIDKDSIGKSKQPPTLEEIKSYIKEKELCVDAEQFYNYFTEGNWTDSKGDKVRNWKQKLITWSKYDGKKSDVKKQNYPQHELPDLPTLDLDKEY